MADAKPARFYAPYLDGLRWLAAFAVFIHHAPPIPGLFWLHEHGWMGVDLFLCISAYLLTTLLLIERERHGSIRLRDFYIRRALRIWPLYFGFATLMSMAAVIWFASPPPLETLGWWLSHLSLSNNIATAIKGYSSVPFTDHLWTISLEEQAYLVLPIFTASLLAASSPRKNLLMLVPAALLMLLAARTAMYLLGAPHPFVWVSPLRGDAFLLGCLLAFVTQGSALKHSWAWLLGGTGLVVVASLFPPLAGPSLYNIFGYTLVAAGFTCIIGGVEGSRRLSALLGIQPFRYLGKISYGVYVYHLVAIGLSQKAARSFAMDNWLITGIALTLTLMLATVSYELFEKRFLRLKRRFTVVESRPV